mmetsp:Transcript_5337/g.9772  ORF Transcript_5337/g.9772 Transcript_5337/m.9772 type:complete len:97 (-) Transcript_5337:406-696(-)
MTGAGWDIWNRNGMGHYFSQPWEGDVDIEVHVSSFTNIVNKYAKAGIMIRADNSDDSTHVFGLLSGKQGICLSARRSKENYSIRIGNWLQSSPMQK